MTLSHTIAKLQQWRKILEERFVLMIAQVCVSMSVCVSTSHLCLNTASKKKTKVCQDKQTKLTTLLEKAVQCQD